MAFLTKRKLALQIGLVCFLFLAFFAVATPHAHAAIKIVPVYKVLQNTDSGTGAQIKEIWKKLMDIVNYFIVAILIAVAIAQILRININTYGIKKILPALVLAIIGANFSFLFCRLLVDLANIVMSLFINGADGAVSSDTLAGSFTGIWADPASFGLKTGVSQSDVSIGMLLWFVCAQLFVIAGATITLLLAYLFFIRIWLIYFLVALSPLAFMATVLPQTKSVFSQWMSNFGKWVFLPVVSIFWIWLGNQWLGNVKEDYVMSYVFTGICYYLAITTPFKMGGAVMTAWGNLGKSIFKNKATGWAWGKARQKWIDPWIKERKDKISSWYLNTGGGNPSVFLNPLGAIARRAMRKEVEREKAALKVEGKKNTLRREAFGGKWYIDKNGERKYKYMSTERRNKYAKEWDSINSDFGEWEWAEKDMDNRFKGTAEGKAIGGADAARRTLAYNFRMGDTENEAAYIEKTTRSEAYGNEENNGYLNNTSFGIVKGDLHWKAMKDAFVSSKQKLSRMGEMSSNKMENDKEKIDFQPAASLGLLKAEHDKWKKIQEELQKRGQTSTAEYAKATSKMDQVARVFERAVTRLEQKGDLIKNGRLSSDAITLKKVLMDENGYVGKDINRAQSLEKVWGFEHLPEETKKMYYSRLRKSIGIIAKEEESSEAGKRSQLESSDRYMQKFRTETLDFLRDQIAEWDNDYKDAWAAVKNSFVSAADENAPKIYSRLLGALDEAYKDSETTEEGRRAVIEKLTTASEESFRAALSVPANIGAATRLAAKQALDAEKTNLGRDLTEEETNRIIQDQYSSPEFRTKVNHHLRARLATIVREREEDLAEMIDVDFTEHGELKFAFKHKDDERQGELNDMLIRTGKKSIYNDIRDRNGGGGARNGLVSGVRKSMAVGSKEAGTYYININDIKVQ